MARLPEEYAGWTDAVSKAVAIDWSGVFLPAQCLSYQSRLVAIYGGSNEIMKELIARTCKVLK